MGSSIIMFESDDDKTGEIVDAIQAAEIFRDPANDFEKASFFCFGCHVEFEGIAIKPRRERYKVSPHFRLKDKTDHKSDCPYQVAKREDGQKVYKIIKEVIPREDCDRVPEELVLAPLVRRVKAPGQVGGESREVGQPTPGSNSDEEAKRKGQRKGRLTSPSIHGIIDFRNRTWSEHKKKGTPNEKISAMLAAIPLRLPSGDFNYESGFVSMDYPATTGRIFRGYKCSVTINADSLIIDSGTQTTKSPNRAVPEFGGKRYIVRLPLDPTRRSPSTVKEVEKLLKKGVLSFDWLAYGECILAENNSHLIVDVQRTGHISIKKAYLKAKD